MKRSVIFALAVLLMILLWPGGTAAEITSTEVKNLKVTYGIEEASLNWEVSTTNNLLNFLVEKKIGAGGWTKVSQLRSSARETTVKSVPPGQTSFRIWAIVRSGSQESTGTILPKEELPKEPPPEEPFGEAGKVKYRVDAKSYADGIEIGWFAKLTRIMAYPPAGDRYPKAKYSTIAYHDAFTTWGTDGLNSTHRAEYVAKAKRDQEVGYIGQFIDDIEWQSGYNKAGSEEEVASLIEAVRVGLGTGAVIELNTQMSDLWSHMRSGDPFVARALAVTNLVDKEFGVSQIHSASGYSELFNYVDALHSKGIHTDIRSANSGDEFALGTYLLLSNGGDFIGAAASPSTWWNGFELNLGSATARERSSSGIWKRSFSGGVVYVAEPGADTQTIHVGPHHTIAGAAVSEITLSSARGAVLLP